MSARTLPLVLLSLLFTSTILAANIQQNDTPPPPLTGWVDMHTHPMAHLGFGGKLIHGAPGLNLQMPTIPVGLECRHYQPATTREIAQSDCRATHDAPHIDNLCGDVIRRMFIRAFEGALQAQSFHVEEGALGYPAFNLYPAHKDITHQQMWVDWIYRAYQGGLRVMVALAVNNRTLAEVVMGTGDINNEDPDSLELQLQQLHDFVGDHTWMEIAKTPADVRRIVGEGRLAIILGVEVDNIGNLQWQAAVSPLADEASRQFVRTTLQDLWAQDVRYIFPIHVVDNKFGGTAIYQNVFNISNYHQTGDFWQIGCAPLSSLVQHRFASSGFDLSWAILKAKIGINPLAEPPPPPACDQQGDSGGHWNTRPLTPLGVFAIEEMMRMGMLIDVDHMSALATQETLAIAEAHDYPVNAGHNGPRAPVWGQKSENDKLDTDYARISALGGMVGLGSADRASNYVRAWQYVRSFVNGNQLAIGTDANGLVILPGPDPTAPLEYDSTFPRLTDGAQTWDINEDGVANYGLFADYVRSFPSAEMTAEQHAEFFSTAEGFARMWEQVIVAQAAMIPTPPTASAGGPYAVNEGGSVTLDASGTTDPNEPASGLTYEWDFDDDGSYDDATGIAPAYVAGDGPATVTVRLRVTDSAAMTGTATATVDVANVAPTATLVQLPPATILQGLSGSFQFTAIADPSPADVAAGFQFTVDCTDDGIYDVDWSSTATATCTYPDAGAFTVRGRIRDKDLGTSETTVVITVLTPEQAAGAIAAMISASSSLNDGQKTALLAMLNHAIALWEGGDSEHALSELGILLKQVEIFRAVGALTDAEAAVLTLAINQLMSSIAAGA